MDSPYRRSALVLGLSLWAAILLALYIARHHAINNLYSSIPDNYPSSSSVVSNTRPSTNQTVLRAQWEPSRRYLVFLPFEGISNQFFSLQNAATIAKRLNRTLVVTPITPNRHDRLRTNQPWSRYMDVEHMALNAVIVVDDILESNQNSTEQFTAQFKRGVTQRSIGWGAAGRYLRFLPRFASYVEDLIAFRFGLLESHIHPHPPLSLGNSILDKGAMAETFLSRKSPLKDYITIHLRRGDIVVKCANQTVSDCITPLSEYKKQVDDILTGLSKDAAQPNVVLVSDTESEDEKKEIDGYGWYRLDHAVDPNLLSVSKELGPFSPAFIDSAVLVGRDTRWVIGSRKSTMFWLAAMRIFSWYNLTIIYPQMTRQEMAEYQASLDRHEQSPSSLTGLSTVARRRASTRTTRTGLRETPSENATARTRPDLDDDDNDDNIITWDKHEQHFFDLF
ncbi:hypothetical protein BC939DRAFT_518930 [Gamsiella multidivaricata]|uniref:uncharacterized protein n=1 Tax=Gamsiella multidivaricata TaxID=101098 RepID=UPI0022207041|nr:uncharacterized protein BC939DRAFT_518930 [Gamsiella multidivaricata]KAI7820784.1 hypothetical protein BC939DRAFT_518930 [Gamsiella multidivaricata]